MTDDYNEADLVADFAEHLRARLKGQFSSWAAIDEFITEMTLIYYEKL